MTIPLSKAERAPPETQRVSPSVAASVADNALLANGVRALPMDAVQAANWGHPGMPHGDGRNFRRAWDETPSPQPADPHRADRDRFVLPSGRGSMLQYVPPRLSGYALPLDAIKHFRQLNSMTPGRPEVGVMPGAETTTEAGVSGSRYKRVGAVDDSRAAIIGIDHFGESAPAGVLFKHFALTVGHVAAAVQRVLEQ